MRLALALAALTLAGPALADDDLTPEKTAKIERDKTKAFDAVDKKYGGRKSSQMSSDERKQAIADRAAAEREVFEKNGVSAKQYTAYTAKMNKSDREATKAASAKLEAKEKADAAAAEKAKSGGPKEIVVQRGFNDQNPVTLEEKESNGQVVVEKGLPPEAENDQADATALSQESAPAAPAEKKH